MKKQAEKDFDCIKMKRDAQEKIYEAIKQMLPEEEISYFQKSIEQSKFREWWKSVSSRVEVSNVQ